MGTFCVVVAPPAFEHDLGLAQAVEDLSIEQLVPQAGVEALDIAVLPRAGLRRFPWRPRSGSACPASDPTPHAAGGHSPAQAPSGAEPGRPSARQTRAATDNRSPP